VAHGRLLVIQNAKFEVGSPGAKIVEDGSQVGELRTDGCLGH